MSTSRPPRVSRLPALAALVSGWILLALVVGHTPVALRTLVTFLFAGFAPGLALRAFVPARDALERIVFTVALSLGVVVLVTLGLALVHHLTTEFEIVTLASVTSVLALLDLVRIGRDARVSAEQSVSRPLAGHVGRRG